eukprot:CAMPEP_0172356010 /NCGR_PEP_ID=MMETSP1060-20121228/346_1 /TAXON_ID=37318 /ORGANISM="Pseudo-nitzschia pungens, Strain cf. cingulata" /LENGTH=400 /DNA_ID=CAMNT_0013075889 /DNA_START=249 /DNA_END=1451 /DNA_ORIENTATION=+
MIGSVVTHSFWCLIVLLSATAAASALALSKSLPRRVSIVTGANGYVGREVVSALLKSNSGEEEEEEEEEDCRDEILCLVRSKRVESETEYWKRFGSSSASPTVKVLPYDMLDGGKTITEALEYAARKDASEDDKSICVYHIASVFGPSEDHIKTANDNVRGTKDLVEAVGKCSQKDRCRLVVTSSMAAVRGSGQTPANGEYYTHEDWNTQSKLEDNNWASSYQWSKMQAEKIAWEIANELKIPMSTICPPFVFGPPTSSGDENHPTALTNSYSFTIFGKWVRGESPVQSRLCVDVRDVARAHVLAASRPEAIGKRIIVSTEARIPSGEMAEILGAVCAESGLGDPSKVTFDGDFKGGAIPIGTKEVDSTGRLKDILGLTLTPVQDTVRDMGRSMLVATTH